MLQVNPSYFKALDLYGLSIGDIPIIRDIYSYAKSGLEALKLSPTAQEAVKEALPDVARVLVEAIFNSDSLAKYAEEAVKALVDGM